MQEFRVATSGLSAQNGMHAGAAVNAVTKSGTNVLHGNAFEFLRDRRFNATNPFARHWTGRQTAGRWAAAQPVRRHARRADGPGQAVFLRRLPGHQRPASTPTDNIAYVPTAAMLAGDFTAFASPACNSGRQIALRAPFVNNRVDPALFSPATLNLAARLPKTDDPCGETQVRPAGTPRPVAGGDPDRLSIERQQFDLRPLHGHQARRTVEPLACRAATRWPPPIPTSTTWRSR